MEYKQEKESNILKLNNICNMFSLCEKRNHEGERERG